MSFSESIVEVAFASNPGDASQVWTNITQYVDTTRTIQINRGSSNEVSTAQVGRATLYLDNTDGRFTPWNAASPYYPNVVKNRRIRIRRIHVTTNYLQGPSFESTSDVNLWGTLGATPPTIARSTTRAHDGAASLLVTWAGGADSVVWQRIQGLQVGQTYTASAWVWVPSGGSPAVQLTVLGIGSSSASGATNAWVQLTKTFVATATTHDFQLVPASAPSAGQQVWLDQTQVNDGASVAAFDATGAYISPRFDGRVAGWPTTWPGGGKMSIATITASDVTKSLDAVGGEIRPMLQEEVLVDGPLAYYPLSEPSGSVSAGDISGGLAGVLTLGQQGTGGTLTFASGTGPPEDGESCPTWTPVDPANGLYLQGDLGAAFQQAAVTNYITIECWFSTTTKGGLILRLHSIGDDYRLWIYLDGTSGQVHVDTAVHGVIQVSTWPSANLADGHVHHVVYDEQTSTVYVDGASLGTQTRNVMVNPRMIEVGGDPYDGLWSGSISHLALYAKNSLGATRIQAHTHAGADGFGGEPANQRLTRIFGYAGVTDLQFAGSLFGSMASQGNGKKTPIALGREVEQTESGHLLARRDSGGVLFQSRDVRYSQVATVTLAAADVESDLTYSDDDQFLTNYVIASRPVGVTITAVNQASLAKYGRYQPAGGVTLLKWTDGDLIDAANWTVSRYGDPPPRLPSLTVVANTLDTTTYRALLSCDVSSLIAVTGLPAQAPYSNDLVCVEGYVETMAAGQHTLSFYCSPASLDQVWVLDNTTFSVLGSTTKLAY